MRVHLHVAGELGGMGERSVRCEDRHRSREGFGSDPRVRARGQPLPRSSRSGHVWS